MSTKIFIIIILGFSLILNLYLFREKSTYKRKLNTSQRQLNETQKAFSDYKNSESVANKKGLTEEQKDLFTQKAKELGMNDAQIRKAIVDKENELSGKGCEKFGWKTKGDLIFEFLQDGGSYEESLKLSQIYDLVCNRELSGGLTNFGLNSTISDDQHKDTPIINVYKENDTTLNPESFTDQFNREQREDCQEKINEYNSCLAEYTSDLAEYNNCLLENQGNKFSFCLKPYEHCYKPLCSY